jgi:hypothetical protein
MYTAPFELYAPAAILSLTGPGYLSPSSGLITHKNPANPAYNPRPINDIPTLAVNTAEIDRKIHPSAAPTPLFSANPQTLRLAGLYKPLRFNIFRTHAPFCTALSRKHPLFSSTYALLRQKPGVGYTASSSSLKPAHSFLLAFFLRRPPFFFSNFRTHSPKGGRTSL